VLPISEQDPANVWSVGTNKGLLVSTLEAPGHFRVLGTGAIYVVTPPTATVIYAIRGEESQLGTWRFAREAAEQAS
jgi:hypothetical protein